MDAQASARAGTLVVVGTGIQWGGQMTLAAQSAIQAADHVFFAVTDPWAVRFIRGLNPAAESLSYPRDGRPRRTIYDAMTKRIVLALAGGKRVCAAFYGSPTFLVRAGHASIAAARLAGHEARMLPGITSVECLAADLGIDLGESGYQLFEATDFLVRPRQVDPHSYLILCQVALIGQHSAFEADSARIRKGLDILRRRLAEVFGARHRVQIYEAARHPLAHHRVIEVELRDLASVELSEVSTLCVPPRGRAPIDEHVASLLAPSRRDVTNLELTAP
jgi:precorrin-6B methylase 1